MAELTILEGLQKGIDDLRKADLPTYSARLRALEIKQKDLEMRLKPLLEILRTR